MEFHFAHIAATEHVKQVPVVFKNQKVHLLLAHLVESDPEYVKYYQDLKTTHPGVFYHLDNSAFERCREGKPMFESGKLLELATTIKADSIVLSDYPGEPSSKTIDAALQYAPIYKEAGFRTFFCPQSRVGDIEDLLSGFRFAVMNPELIDFIGVSILACPNALGIEQVAYDKQGQVDEAYRMQRYLSRWRVLQLIEERNLLPDSTQAFHLLGLNDGIREISLLEPWHEFIFSWDSSSAYQHAIHGIRFDSSPTGLRNGKLDKHVDFATNEPMTVSQLQDFLYNVSYVNELIQES